MAKGEGPEKDNKDKGEKPDNKTITVTVDGQQKQIERGNYSVAEFKSLVGVADNMDLDELVNGKFEPVDESKKLHIKGEEIFVSHVKTGQSS
jgi:hypothetical protein